LEKDNQIRILWVSAIIDPILGGGGGERARSITKELSKLGYLVTLLTAVTDKDSFNDLHSYGVDLVVMKCLNDRLMIPLSISGIRNLLRRHDLIHINGHWTLINALIFVFCLLDKKPYVVSPIGSLKLFGRSIFVKRIYNMFIGKALIQNANAHIAVTDLETYDFFDYDVISSKVYVIPNGVNSEEYVDSNINEFRNKFKLESFPIILFIGRLNLIKGPDILLEAFNEICKHIPSYKLLLAGPDEGLSIILKKNIKKFGLCDRVHLTGYLSRKDKINAYHAAELLVIPSRHEAMSIVALEAGAAGTPILLTRECGFDVIESIGGGMVVKADSKSIANGLQEMLSSPDKLFQMGLNLQNFVKKNYSWRSVAIKHSKIYNKVFLDL
jgi:glycosyltransferase involved in cell wall biosynthesis